MCNGERQLEVPLGTFPLLPTSDQPVPPTKIIRRSVQLGKGFRVGGWGSVGGVFT